MTNVITNVVLLTHKVVCCELIGKEVVIGDLYPFTFRERSPWNKTRSLKRVLKVIWVRLDSRLLVCA